MNAKSLLRILIPVILLLVSCQKDFRDSLPGRTVAPVQPPAAAKGNLVRMQQGAGTGSERTYLLTYDSLNRIRSVTDSAHHDTLNAGYNAAGKLMTITGKFSSSASPHASFTYGAGGLLMQVDYTIAGTDQRLVFEYNGTAISKKSYYTAANQLGQFQLFDYFIYTVSGGNITRIEEFNSVNQLVNEKLLTYGAEGNPFRDFSLFNFANNLSAEDIMNSEVYFCTNVLTGFNSSSQMQTLTNSFTRQKPARIAVSYKDPFTSYQLTWLFEYN